MTLENCVLQIDLNIIKNNYKILQKTAPTAEIGAAVKANCYGLGMDKIAPALEMSGAEHFFVATRDEGAELRSILKNKNSNIYVLNGYFHTQKMDFIENNLIPVLNNESQVKLWQNLTYEIEHKLPCFVHINTGMNRLGMREYEVLNLQNNELDILCVMSHLSSSEDIEAESNQRQLAKFKELSKLFPHSKKSLVNSSGIFLGQEYHFDIARPGAALYGLNPTPYLPTKSEICNPITLIAPIIQISKINRGESVGYNETYKAQKDMIIATLPLGYADGYMRFMSNRAIAFISNQEVQVVGRISMDLVTIDVSNINPSDLFLGQKVEILGPNITPDEIAKLAHTNGYEIVTMLGNRFKRIYI